MRRVQLDIDERPKPRPIVEVVESVNGPWVNNNQWGIALQDPWPNSEGQVKMVLDMPSLPGPPAVHTVILDRFASLRAANSDIRAVIEFGSGGNRNTFECDWANGVQVSMVANSVRVSYKTWKPNANIPYAVQSQNLGIAAMVGKGTRPNFGTPPSYTDVAQTLTGGATRTYTVPDYARNVTILNDKVTTPADIQIAVRSSGDAGAPWLVDAAYFITNPTVPLPSGAYELVITVNGATVSQPRVIWGLAL